MAGTTRIELATSAVKGGKSITGTSRISSLGVRYSATVGSIGTHRLILCNVLCNDLFKVTVVFFFLTPPRHGRTTPSFAASPSAGKKSDRDYHERQLRQSCLRLGLARQQHFERSCLLRGIRNCKLSPDSAAAYRFTRTMSGE